MKKLKENVLYTPPPPHQSNADLLSVASSGVGFQGGGGGRRRVCLPQPVRWFGDGIGPGARGLGGWRSESIGLGGGGALAVSYCTCTYNDIVL